MVQTVAILGAGVIGLGWAAHFAAHGWAVRLYDPDPARREAAPAAVTEKAALLASLRGGEASGVVASGAVVSAHADLAEAVAGVDFVQENTPERADLKKEVFAALDGLLPPQVVVASSTSGLPISPLQEGLAHPERFVIGHPFNPVHLMPLVEVVAGDKTSAGTVARVTALYEGTGKVTIRVNREASGHLANRLQAALWREAVAVVEDGLASVEDVDKALVHGLGLRWAVCGPHMTFHLGGGDGGLRHFIDHLGPGIQKRWREFRTPELTPDLVDALVEGVEREAAGASPQALAAARDDALVALLRLRYASD